MANIGKVGRALIRLAIKKDAQVVIDLIERNYIPAIDALLRGDVKLFFVSLPPGLAENLVREVIAAAIPSSWQPAVAYLVKGDMMKAIANFPVELSTEDFLEAQASSATELKSEETK